MEVQRLEDVTPDLKKILLIGVEGTGKTHFIATMPKPIHLFSFDKGYLTLAGIPDITYSAYIDEDRYRAHAYADFKRDWDAFKRGDIKYTGKDGKAVPYRTVAIDSVTALSKCIFDHEQKMNNTVDRQGGFGVWGNVKSKLQDVVLQSLVVADYTVFTAIVEANKDDLTQEIFFTPSTEGKFREEMGQWMDAVLFMQVDKNRSTGAKVYQMLTVGDRRMRAKIRIPSSIASKVDAIEDPDFEKLMTKIRNAYNQHKQGGK